MRGDADPRNYRYEDAARVLTGLGFAEAKNAGTSHRKWRRRNAAGTLVVIGLVKKGHGPLQPVYIRTMIDQLIAHRFIPAEVID